MKRREALKHTALLGGSTVLASTLLTFIQACKEQSRLDWQPRFLSTDHALLVAALVDTILPTTDTPGGLDVKVDMFIDLVFDQMYDAAAKQAVVAELDAFNESSNSKFGKAFPELEAAQKQAFLQEKEAQSPKFGYGVWGVGVGEKQPVGFYRSFKSLAIMGYCTSEEIGKHVLKYDPVPGEFLGCIPLSDVGGVWSL